MSDVRKEVAVVGSVTLDHHIEPQESQDAAKVLSRIWWTFGGFAFNVALVIAALRQCQLRPIFLLGQGFQADVFKEQAGDRFRQARFLECDDPMRSSVLIHGQDKIYTTRPKVSLKSLPEDVVAALTAAAAVLIGPMTPDDRELVTAVLATNPETFLVLSREQLRDRSQALELIAAAGTVVLNQQEAYELTLRRDPNEAIKSIHERTGSNVIVTGEHEIHARFDGNWYRQACFVPLQVARTGGCGDVLTATLASCIASGETVADALLFAAAAAGRHAEGAPAADLDTVRAWSNRRDLRPSPAPTRRERQYLQSIGASAAAVLRMLVTVAQLPSSLGF